MARIVAYGEPPRYFKCLTGNNPHKNTSKSMVGGGIDLVLGKKRIDKMVCPRLHRQGKNYSP